MKFSRLLKESKLFWPSTIRIEDGELRAEGGGFFPTLSKVWGEVEVVQSSINEWHGLMSWVVFSGFHSIACSRLAAGNTTQVMFYELEQSYMAAKFNQNLKVVYPSWPKQMRCQYVDDSRS